MPRVVHAVGFAYSAGPFGLTDLERSAPAVADRFRLSLVTPEAKLVDEEVTYASVPAWDGQLGFAPGRAPILVKLGIGALRLEFPGGGERWFLIEGGFAQMTSDHLMILAGKSTPAENAIESDASRELDAALEIIATSEPEYEAKSAAVEAARQKRRLARLVGSRGI